MNNLQSILNERKEFINNKEAMLKKEQFTIDSFENILNLRRSELNIQSQSIGKKITGFLNNLRSNSIEGENHATTGLSKLLISALVLLYNLFKIKLLITK